VLKTTSNNLSKIIQILLLLIVLLGCMRVEPPENIKVNPNPPDKFIVTVHIDGYVEIQELKASKRFLVVNESKCSPVDLGRSLGGSWNSIEKNIESNLLPIAHNTFKTVYTPKMYLDEPYYSMEVCRWQGFGIDYRFSKKNVLYSFNIDDSDITQSGQVSIQCEGLRKNRTDGISQRCKSHSPHELSMIGRSNLFEIKVNSRRISK
jgi:hypothetical protein